MSNVMKFFVHFLASLVFFLQCFMVKAELQIKAPLSLQYGLRWMKHIPQDKALKSRSNILDIVHVKLSLEIFLFSELFNGEIIAPAFTIKNTQQKAKKNIFFSNFNCGNRFDSKLWTCFVGGFLMPLVWRNWDMPMQRNAMLWYVKKENNLVSLTRIWVHFVQRLIGLPLFNFSGFSLE